MDTGYLFVYVWSVTVMGGECLSSFVSSGESTVFIHVIMGAGSERPEECYLLLPPLFIHRLLLYSPCLFEMDFD